MLLATALLPPLLQGSDLQSAGPPPVIAVAPAESLTSAPPRTAHRLALILDGTYRPALPELLSILEERGQLLPPASLPQLLNLALEKSALLPTILAAGGKRLAWLAAAHPLWRQLLPIPAGMSAGEVRETLLATPKDERVDLLSRYRAANAAAAREALQDLSAKLGSPELAKMIAGLAAGLTPEDEPFLLEYRRHGRKEVREAAAGVLAQLPSGTYQDESLALLTPLFSNTKKLLGKRQLSLELPATVPKDAKFYGISAKGGRSGAGLSYLLQLLEQVPPARLTEKLNVTPPDFLNFIHGRREVESLRQAIAIALDRHPDPEWQAALLRYILDRNNSSYWRLPIVRKLFRAAPASIFTPLATEWLQEHGPLIPASHPLTELLRITPHPWSDYLARTVLDGALEAVNYPRSRGMDDYHILLKRAAYRVSPTLFDHFRSRLGPVANRPDEWGKTASEVLAVLYFRRGFTETGGG
ncbi:MAG: DUF5691 domain-containing protein [Saprospiraceae bacterium]